MRVNGLPNKFEIFQDYYYVTNGEVITYGEALKLFSQMEAEEKTAFEQYYKDETGYEVIGSGNGYNLSPELEAPIKVSSSPDKYKKSNHVSQSTLNNIATKYTIEAYAKENGMTIASQWAQYSAEEIIQMENEGVNIPQDVVDAAHSIYESTGGNADTTEEGDETTEKEPFLNLIPKAQKNIKKCNENNEKIDDKIEELLPERNKRQKKLKSKMKDQKNSLKEYEDYIREWRRIQNKVNNGEELTDTEAKRYAKITGMLNENKSKNNGFEIDKREIAKSLNELNILAVLGEKLAVETIEIGDTLADYTSKANYKTTRNQASGQIGFFAAIIAMAQGKNLAIEANKIGNDTKEYTDETHQSVMDIANIVGIEGSIADVKGNSAENDIQITKEASEAVETEKSDETAPENNEEKVENDAAQKTNDTNEEDFIINDENVLKLVDEAGITNDELRKQIVFALESIKEAKSDKVFAKFAGKKIEKLVNEFNKQEEVRQQQIKKLEEENEKINEEKERAERIPEAVAIDETENENNNKTLDENNKEIENIKAESDKAREDFKVQTTTEKSIIDEAIPSEDEAFNTNTEFKNTLIPTFTEQLDFTNASGITLAKIGTYMFEMGLAQMMGFMFSKRAIWLMHAGLKNMTIGAQAQKEATRPYLKVATKATTEAEALTGEALTELTAIDAKIVSVTGDDAAETAAEQTTEENTENGIVEANTEASVNDMENADKPASQPVAQTEVETPSQTSADTSDKPSTVKMVEENQSYKDKIRAMMKNGEKSEKTSSNTQKSKKNENKEISKEEAQKSVDDTKASAKDDNKDSVHTLQDTQKDEKQLEKEAKQIQKKMKRDQKEIVKMTKESQKAAKKQEEMLAEYEALTNESEQLIAEDEQKKQSNAAIQPANNNAQNEQQSDAASSSFSMSIGENNTQKLQENDQRINILGTQFKLQGKVITRNSVKIKKLQKTTKTNQKKFDKKVKVRETKIKEAEKKEQDKQKRLAKQLGAVGIAENVFSITVATGTIMAAIPWTAAAGAILIKVGTYGIVCCGLTKAMINLANGNLTAALIGLGQTAVTAAMSLTGTGAAASTVMQCVSAGLQVVSSSAELVNNVRAVQGKEANGVFSKIATIAGVAGSLTNAASSLKDIGNTADTFGKALTIASVTGTAMSSASQLMSEFGGESKLANILGMVGGGIQLAASVGQLAQKFSGAEAKNEENKDKTESKDDTNTDDKKSDNTKTDKNSDKNPDGTPKTEEQKKAEAKQKKEADKQAKEQKKAQEKQQKEAEKAQKQQEQEKKKAELDEAKKAKNDKKAEAKDVKDKDAKKNMIENGASKEFADHDDNMLEDYRLEAIGQGNDELAAKYAAEQQQRADYRAKMGLIAENNQAKQEKIDLIMQGVSSATNVVGQIMSMSNKDGQQQNKKKGYAAQWDLNKDKRYKKIKNKREIQLARQNYRYKRAS